MTVTEKVAYLRGLVEGFDIDLASKEGKILKAITDVLDELAFSVVDMEDGYAELSEQVDEIDEDLNTLEEEYYGELDDEDDDCCCDEGDLYEVECPACGDTICIDEDMLLEGEMECPNCGEKLEFELPDDCCCGDDGCDCGCDHDHE